MESLLSSKRTKAILGIGLIAIGIGANFKKGYQLSNWRMYEGYSRIDFK